MPFATKVILVMQGAILSKHVATVVLPPVTYVVHSCPISIGPAGRVCPVPMPVCVRVSGTNPEVFCKAGAELMNEVVFLLSMNGYKIAPMGPACTLSIVPSSFIVKVSVAGIIKLCPIT